MFKAAARSVTPPILWESARRLKDYLAGLRLRPHDDFEGPLSSWEEAVALSDGWDSPAITTKALAAPLQVRDGCAAFEQDTIVYDKISYSPTILAFLFLALARQKERLHIIDLGGSLGSNYFQHRKLLTHLTQTAIAWNIIDRPHIVQLGHEHIQNSELKFFPSIEAVKAGLADLPEAFLFSGSLQYFSEPLSALNAVITAGAKIIAFDRVLVSPQASHAIYIQHPDPEQYYAATYPVWCFSRDALIGHVTARGFKLVEHFTPKPTTYFDHCGMLFARHERVNRTYGP
jgi:putative methyltransferase (TIGR04325 family)